MEDEFKKSVDAAYLEFQVEPMDQLYSNKIAGYFSRLRVKKILAACDWRGKTALDLGCEAGYVSLRLYRKGAKVIPVDICAPALEKFKEKLRQLNIVGIEPLKAPAQKLPLRDASVDIAVATEVFEHMPELDKVIAEAARVLKPAGKIIVTFPNEPLRKKVYWLAKLFGVHTEIEKDVTLYSYTEQEIKDRLQKHFIIKRAYSFPFYFPLTRFILAEKP